MSIIRLKKVLKVGKYWKKMNDAEKAEFMGIYVDCPLAPCPCVHAGRDSSRRI